MFTPEMKRGSLELLVERLGGPSVRVSRPSPSLSAEARSPRPPGAAARSGCDGRRRTGTRGR